MTDSDCLDELRRRLVDEIELLAETLLGQPNRAMSTRRQLRFGARGSLAIELRHRRGTWCSHETGDGGGPLGLVAFALGTGFAGAVAWARDWSNQAPQSQPAPRAAAQPGAQPPRPCTEAWRSIWAATAPISGTLAEIYLQARGCAGIAPEALRFHPTCPRGAAERLPALVALMTDPADNQPIGIHRTFLRSDGAAKIEHGTAKMMLGGAGVIRLAPDDEITIGLGICEGIETALALINRAGWRSIWAAGSAGAIAKFPVLRGIECLTLFPDADDSGAGGKAAEACADRWTAAAREVQTIWPPAGTDWLDALALKVAA